MFEWMGKDVLNGIIKAAKDKLSGIDFGGIIKNTPFLRVLPYIVGYWDNLSEEEKKENAAIIFKAAMKALSAYAKS